MRRRRRRAALPEGGGGGGGVGGGGGAGDVSLQKGNLLSLDRQSIRVQALTLVRFLLLFQHTRHRNA
jgi:hypothetical protein